MAMPTDKSSTTMCRPLILFLILHFHFSYQSSAFVVRQPFINPLTTSPFIASTQVFFSSPFCPWNNLSQHYSSIPNRSADDAGAGDGDDGNNQSRRRTSRLEGNQRPPSAQEIEIMDEMITKLANAKAFDLPNAVQRAFRVISSPQFFLRIVERIDLATNEVEKEQLAALASNLVSTLNAVVSTAQDKIDEITHAVETIVKAAAEPDSGEFLVPLSVERIDAMKFAMDSVEISLLDGDAFLTTVDAWMNKSHQDGLDGMVVILQKVLQFYAGRFIRQKHKNEVSAIFQKLLQTDADAWDNILRNEILSTDMAQDVARDIQRCMETIVLALESGSMAQQVQAEYLREMLKRIESVEGSL